VKKPLSALGSGFFYFQLARQRIVIEQDTASRAFQTKVDLAKSESPADFFVPFWGREEGEKSAAARA
jgi:hypothetical protein